MRELWKMMAFLQLLLCAYRDANPTVRSYININIFLAQVLLPHISCYTVSAGTATHPGFLHQDLKSASQPS